MNLQEILERYPQRPAHSVPDWMLGFYKRRAISFANGLTDVETQVCWLQSRNFTIDLRLPLPLSGNSAHLTAKGLEDYSPEELQELANQEGWEAACAWDGETLSWHSETSFQLNNRWPEPALLKRIGDCMIEFAPSGAYVEDWRLQVSNAGPLIGLRLLEEREVGSNVVRHRGGGLIVCGDYAALVLGRPQALVSDRADEPLRDWVARHADDVERLKAAFNFETSVAKGSLARGYDVALSTQASRLGQPLCALDGFEYLADPGRLRQRLVIEGVMCERTFVIDTLEAAVSFDPVTGFTPAARTWFERESPTLGRYTKQLG